MIINIRPRVLILLLSGLISCKNSPTIDFHSYQELSEYSFIDDGWFPEILNDDAINIDETYDVVNKHVFGKFDFKDRLRYDSIIGSYPVVAKDAILILMDKIERPSCPDWFVPMDCINHETFVLSKQEDFYLIMDRTSNRIYFFR